MKKNIVIAAIIVIIIAGGLFGARKFSIPGVIHTTPTITVSHVPAITVMLNTGEDISTVSGIPAENVYSALAGLAKKEDLALKTKQYDFGVFVEAIGTLANTKEKAWIYFVNGKAGTVAADKQNLHSGDTVEWKYMTPTIE